jgi:hypothetical protein
MPCGGRRLDGDESMLVWAGSNGHKWIQAAMTWASKQNLLGGLVLDQKEKWVNFNKGIVV